MSDVFISYAKVDNEPAIPSDESTRWISSFQQSLHVLLDQELGKRATDVWMDLQDLAGHGSLPQKLRDAIEGSSTLVVMLTRGYLESDWCREERELFFRAAPTREEALDRVFLIQLTDIPRSEWPDEFSDLVGYAFYHNDPDTGRPIRLAYPVPDPREKAYFRLLNKLGAELGAKLIGMRQETRPVPAGSASSPAAASEEGAFTVFLAKGTPDLDGDRDAIAAYLAGRGHLVLPQRFYDPAPDTFLTSIGEDLKRSSLFVQPLGPYATFRTDEFPQGYEGLQLQGAESAGIPVLRWRRKDLSIDEIPDRAHRKFVESGVMAMDLEDFKFRLGDEIDRLRLRQSLPAPGEEDKLVLLHASKDDAALVERISNLLIEHNLGYEVLDEDTRLDKAVESQDFRGALLGLVVVYGLCPVDWLKNQLRALRRIVMGKRDDAPACGVYLGTGENGKFLPIRFARLHVVDDTSVHPFLNSLMEGGAVS